MLTEIRTRIAQQLNIPVDNITADSKLVDDLKADSLDIVELVREDYLLPTYPGRRIQHRNFRRGH